MEFFNEPVSRYMTMPAVTLGPQAHLSEVEQQLRDLDVASLPIVDAKHGIMGIITRSDLLRTGTIQTVSAYSRQVVRLQDERPVTEVMSRQPWTVRPDATLSEAARIMAEQRVHQLLVAVDETLQGVLSTSDVMRAVAEERLPIPIERLMVAPVYFVHPARSAREAIGALADHRVRALVVVEGDWPIGIFGEEEALAAQRTPFDTRVEDWLQASLLCLPPRMPAHRAAAQAVTMRARHIVVMESGGVTGMLTDTDMAHAAVVQAAR